MADGNFEVDVKEFCFKQLCQLQVFDTPQTLITDIVNLLVVSNKYAKIYVVAGTEVKQIDVATIEKLTSTPGVDLKTVVTAYDHKSINTRKNIKHIALSCDDLTLSVVFEENGVLWVGYLDVRWIGDQSLNECFFAKGQLTTESGVTARELKWHPEDPESALVCLSNGSVSQIKIVNQSAHIIFTLPQGSKCFSVDWSTRGKNFAAGQEDGRLMLYDRKMVLKKELPCPEEFRGTKHQLAKVKWISSHNFAAVYLNAEAEEPPKFFCIVTQQKDGPTMYTNMEDIYFGYNEDRQLCFYIEALPEWNMLTTMASNAFEGVPIGKLDNKWMRWNLDDSSRVVMPFANDNDETFPCGIAINLNSTLVITEGESKYPPAPLFMLVSTHGILCTYQMLNKFQGVNHNVVVKATAMSLDGVRKPMQASQLSSSRQPPQVKPVETKTGIVESSLPKPFSGAAFGGFTSTGPVKPAAKEQTQFQASAISSKEPASSFITTTSSSLFSAASAGFTFDRGSSNLFTTPTKTDVPSSSGKLPSLFQQVQTQATNLTSSNKEPLASAKNTAQEIPPAESSTASMKPLSFDSKANLFASATAATKPLFDFGSKVAPFSQQNVTSSVQEVSKPVSAFGFVFPRPTAQATVAQASTLTFSGFTQPETGSKQQSVLAPSSTAFGANASLQIAKPESAVKPQAQQQVLAGRVPPGSRLLQMTSQTQTKPAPQQAIAAVEELPPVQPVQTVPARKETSQPSVHEEASKIDKMSKDLGYAINKSIMEEMSAFSKELSDCKVEMKSCEQMVNGIGTRDEMISLKRDTDLVSKIISDFQGCHKEHQNECYQLKNKMMKSFDNFEQARVQETSISDRRYNSLLKTRALDPVTSRQRKELRSQLNYLTSLISDVNDSLDIALEQAQMNGSRRGKSLKTNGMHNIYVAMGSIDKIINNLANQIDAISVKAEKTDVISQSVMHRGGSRTQIQEEEKGSIKSPHSSAPTKSPGMSPLKQSQFQAFLTKTGGSPVKKSSHRESFSFVKPRAASTPATNSTARNVFDYQPETPATGKKLETLKELKIESTLKSFPKFVAKPVKTEDYPENLATSSVATEQSRTVRSFQSKPMSFPEEKPSVKPNLHPAVTSISAISKPQQLISGFMKPLIPAGEQPKSSPGGLLGGKPPTVSQASSTVQQFGIGKLVAPVQFAKTAPAKASITSTGAVIPTIPTSRPKSEAVGQLGLSSLGSSSFKLGMGSNTVFGSAEPTQSNVGAFGAPARQSPGLSGPISTANMGLSISDSGSAFTSNAKAKSNPDLFGTATKPLFGATTSSMPLWSTKSTEPTGQFTSISKLGTTAPPSMPLTTTTAPKQSATTSTGFDVGDKSKAIFKTPEGPTKSVAVAFNPSSLWSATPPLPISSTLTESSKSDGKTLAMPSVSSSATEKLFSAVPTSSPKLTNLQGTVISSPSLTSAQPSPGKDEPKKNADIASIVTISGSVPSATGGIFGSSKSGSLFGTKPSQPSGLFGSQAQAGALQGVPSTTSGTLFGSHLTLTAANPITGSETKTSASGLLGTSNAPAKSPLFSMQPVDPSKTPTGTKATTTTANLFGTSAATTSVGQFGSLPSASSQPTSFGDRVKGSITTTTSSSDKPSLFGSKANVSSSSALTATDSADSGAVKTDQAKGILGSSLFGPTTTSIGLFGSKSDVSAASAFTATNAAGNVAAVTQPSQGLFGSSGFGATATTSDKPSLFGSKSNVASTSAFTSTNAPESKPVVTQQSQGLFGSKPAEPLSGSTGLFGSGSAFGSTSTGGGLFSSQSTSAPGGLFQSVTTSQAAFGSTAQAAFGQTSSGFGSQQPSSTSGVGFGGFGLGGKPTNDPSKNPFGSVPVVSSNSGGSTGLFGSTSTGFGPTSQTISPAGKGAFSKGFGSGFASGGAAITTGFDAATTGASAFGGSATFGGGATFGGSGASFGGTPAFGGAPAFGSTSPAGPAFGSGTPGSTPFGSSNSGFGQTASFGALGQQSSPSFGGLNSQAGNATFGNLAANQNAPGFGNLADQSSFGQSGASFGQTSSPQGSSFSSWR